MPYKPKFCCQCGEKIERVEWKLLTSRRFCEFCATEYGVYDKIPLILVSVSVLFGLYGIGSYWRAPEKALNVAPNQLVASAPVSSKSETRANQALQISSNTSVQAPAQTKTEIVPAQPNVKIERADVPAQETVYICGAMTKKGSPCSRRVKNGGRCWQHEGKEAMLPPEKLIVRKN
jgi:hypothetical protein